MSSHLQAINTKLTALDAKVVALDKEQSAYATGAAVTPSDSVNFAEGASDALWVGGAGNISLELGGATLTLTGVTAGALLPVAATRVNLTATTATNMVALRREA